MKVLVTGGGGFLGKAIVKQLIERGDHVRSVARGDYPELRTMGAETIQGDLADPEVMLQAAAGMDAMIHVAAKPGMWGDYQSYYRPNVVGTENVLAACREHGIRKLVYTSSPSVVDAGEDIAGGDESLPYPHKFVAPYPETKAIAEKMVIAANGSDLYTVSIRPPLIWGPGDNHLMPRMLDRAKRGRLIKIGGAGKLLDTTYIDNAAEAHLLALDKLTPDSPINGKVYFISNDEPVQAFDLIEKVVVAAGYPPPKVTLPASLALGVATLVEGAYRGLNIKQEPQLYRALVQQLTKARWFDISAAKRDLGYMPRVSIAGGLERLKASF